MSFTCQYGCLSPALLGRDEVDETQLTGGSKTALGRTFPGKSGVPDPKLRLPGEL
jgi:hypothetical protein